MSWLLVVGTVLGLGVISYFIWPFFKPSSGNVYEPIRKAYIKQTKGMIEEYNISKDELFDE